MIAMRKQHSATFKAEVVREILREQKTIAQIASEYGVHPTLLYQWRDAALAALPMRFSDQSVKEQAVKEAAYQQQIDQLYREVGKLTTQLNWLKKKLDISLTTSQRKEMVGLREPELPLRQQCELLTLNRSSLYYQPKPTRPQDVVRRKLDLMVYDQVDAWTTCGQLTSFQTSSNQVGVATSPGYSADLRCGVNI